MGKVIVAGGATATKPIALPPVGTALNDMTWEQIKKVSDSGVASNYVSVGDIKTITINGMVGITEFSNLELGVYVIGIDHNASVEGSNRIHLHFCIINGYNQSLCDAYYNNSTATAGVFNMNSSNTTVGGWELCRMRATILGSDSTPTNPTANTLIAALPSDLRAVMKPVTKYTDNMGGTSNLATSVTSTTDYLFLLSEFEISGVRKYANSAEQNYQKQYDYYKAGNSKKKYGYQGGTMISAAWWTRSIQNNMTTNFTHVTWEGVINVNYARTASGVAPAFAV